MPVTDVKAPLLITKPLIVSEEVAAVMVPAASTENVEPFITVGPVASPKVKVPVPLAVNVNPVSTVEAEITGEAPANVKAEEVKVLVL